MVPPLGVERANVVPCWGAERANVVPLLGVERANVVSSLGAGILSCLQFVTNSPPFVGEGCAKQGWGAERDVILFYHYLFAVMDIHSLLGWLAINANTL